MDRFSRSTALCAFAYLVVACGCSHGGGGGGFSGSTTNGSTFSTAATLQTPRVYHASVLLPGGTILVIGGKTPTGTVTATTEIFDPVTNTATLGPTLATPRMKHAAVLLPNKKVLVVGGQSDVAGANALSSTEIYDAATNKLSAGPTLSEARSGPSTAFFTQNGLPRVLIAGGLANGVTSRTAEIYDADINTLVGVASKMVEDREGGSALALSSGEILIQGGWSVVSSGTRVASSEIFQLGTGNFTPAPNVVARAESTLAEINSTVYAFGGTDGAQALSSVEQFDGQTWSLAASSLATPRRGHAVASLNSTVIVTGGYATAPTATSSTASMNSAVGASLVVGALASTELYGFGPAASMVTARAHHSATALPSGEIVIIGGENGSTVLGSIEVYGRAGSTVAGSTIANTNSASSPAQGMGKGQGQGQGQQAQQGQGKGQGSSGVAAVASLSLDQASPAQGSVGDTVNLKGMGFNVDPTKDLVSFGGTAAKVQLEQSNPNHDSLQVDVPAGLKPGVYMITVTVGGKVSNALPFTVK